MMWIFDEGKQQIKGWYLHGWWKFWTFLTTDKILRIGYLGLENSLRMVYLLFPFTITTVAYFFLVLPLWYFKGTQFQRRQKVGTLARGRGMTTEHMRKNKTIIIMRGWFMRNSFDQSWSTMPWWIPCLTCTELLGRKFLPISIKT